MKYFRWIALFPWGMVASALWPLAGVALIGYGAFQIYPPAAYIAVGSLLVLDSLHASWPKKTEQPK